MDPSTSSPYPLPKGVHPIPPSKLDLRPDTEIDHDLLHPPAPTTSEKNIWFFWHSGFTTMHPYCQRTVRAWHRRFSKSGWTVRVIDRLTDSPLNVANFLDIHDEKTFPKSFRDGTLGGDHAAQHTSDLVRFPLLLKYGGVYADVGLIQIGDLDRMWEEYVANPESEIEVLGFNQSERRDEWCVSNYFLCARRNNTFFERCHRLLLTLWAADGGKLSTEGMHASPLLRGLPLMGEGEDMSITENGKVVAGPDEVPKILTDYIIQGHVITLVMSLVDEETGWNGPQYVFDHMYLMEFYDGQKINEMTAWDGPKAFQLMSLSLPNAERGEEESADQKHAREIVQTCLATSFSFKLAHGLIVKVMGDTLGSLWRKRVGSDDVAGTYAHWLRYGTIHWGQDKLPSRIVDWEGKMKEPIKRGPLLRAEGEISGVKGPGAHSDASGQV